MLEKNIKNYITKGLPENMSDENIKRSARKKANINARKYVRKEY